MERHQREREQQRKGVAEKERAAGDSYQDVNHQMSHQEGEEDEAAMPI